MVSKSLELHSPFFCALQPFKDFENETSPSRILLDYSGLIYLEQMTVHFNDAFVQKIKLREVLELIESLDTFTIVDFAKVIQRALTFSYKVIKNTFNKISSTTFFFWINRHLTEITMLRGRFHGNFRLPSKRSMQLSCVFDCLFSLGFEEAEDVGEIENFDIFSIYPIFSSFEIHTKQSVEIAETVEELKLSEDFSFCPHSHTVLVAERHTFSDPFESDVLIKSLFTENFYPELGIILEDSKIYLILDNCFLESLLVVSPSFTSFCDPPICFLDPFYSLHPSFSKSF